MLAVAIESNKHVEGEFLERVAKPGEEGSALAAIACEGEHPDPSPTFRRDAVEDLAGLVGRAVIHSNHVIGVGGRLTHHLSTERSDIVAREHAAHDWVRPSLSRVDNRDRSDAQARAGDRELAPPRLVEKPELAL